MNTQSQKGKLAFLDGVRGIAMIIVVLHHFAIAFFPAVISLDPGDIHLGNGQLELAVAKTPLNIFLNGGFAVSVFFVLSGFVLSYKYHLSGDQQILRAYAAKRYFRLFIPVAGIIVICYVMHLCGLFNYRQIGEITKSGDWLNSLFHDMKGPGDALKNLFFDVFFSNDNRYNAVLWTMTIEFLGSLLLFSFLALVGKNKNALVLHVMVAILILYTDRKYYAAFILGSFICKLFVNGFSFPKGIKGMAIKALILLLGIYFSSYPQGGFTSQSIWKVLEWANGYEFFHVLGAFCILLVICFDKTFRQFFSLRPFLYLGKISFAFYLLHLAVMCSLGCFIFRECWQPGTYVVPFLISFSISMALTFLLAHFYYLFIDKSGIRFSEKIGNRITRETGDQ